MATYTVEIDPEQGIEHATSAVVLFVSHVLNESYPEVWEEARTQLVTAVNKHVRDQD